MHFSHGGDGNDLERDQEEGLGRELDRGEVESVKGLILK